MAGYTYALYSDERWDNISSKHILMLGGITSTLLGAERLRSDIMQIRNQHQLHGELKWTKISSKYSEAYQSIIDCLYRERTARFSVMVCDQSSSSWQKFTTKMGRSSKHDDPLASAYYQFLLIAFGGASRLKSWCIFPDQGFFRRDSRVNSVEFLLNRTYKKAWGSHTRRQIAFSSPLNSKTEDLIQLSDALRIEFDQVIQNLSLDARYFGTFVRKRALIRR